MSVQKLKLIIIGAGCSYGMYPLADEMFGELERFAARLEEPALEVKACVIRTLELMNSSNGVRTIDQLVERIHNGCLDSSEGSVEEIHGARIQRIAEAKLALVALFLDKEYTSVKTGLQRYHDFLDDLFPSTLGDHYLDRMEKSPYRVLSFNYDRLFEAALLQHFKVDSNSALYGPYVLNSGIDQWNSRIEFADDRFCFLKLHGSVGMIAVNTDGLLRHNYNLPCLNGPFPIRDDMFFDDAENGSRRPKPTLIVFPHEKGYLFDSETACPYQAYARGVWRQAKMLAEQAEEIWLIGYSVGKKDMPYLSEQVLLAARDCKQVIVQNPAAHDVAEDLANRVPAIAGKLKPYKREF